MTNAVTPAMEQYLTMKEQYKDCILFYRLGDFYEMFFEDAELASRELGITLTGKSCGLPDRAPMCGIPFHAYESYVAKLINKGYKVAICEQLAEPTKGVKLVPRDVVRVITPGTVIDSDMLDENANTHIMCIYKNKNTISYAYADISTGEFYVGENSKDKVLNYINDQIVRVMPAEIICNEEMLNASSELPVVQSNTSKKFNQYFEWAFNYSTCEKTIFDAYNITTLKGYDFATTNSIIVVGALWQYLLETQKRELKHLSMPKFIHDEQYMYIDTNTRRNLEIEQTMRDGSKYGSLLWVLDKTQTGGGARKLRSILNQPLQDINQINYRLNVIEAIKNNDLVRASLLQEYKGIRDIERIVAKLSYNSISPRDCISIYETLQHTPNIKAILLNSGNRDLIELGNSIEDCSVICNKIFDAINPDAPIVIKDGNFIKKGFSKELDNLRALYTDSKQFILDMEAREKEATGIKNLKIGYNRVFGYYIEINRQYSDIVPFRYVRKQTISNNERYITEELKKFEEDVLSSEEKALKLEQTLFSEFKNDLMQYCYKLQNLANIISTLDVYISLAVVAEENNYIRPTINTTSKITIKNGRHPVIEKLQKKDVFISNDTFLDNNENRTMILTGPNMAGKSTYMRQVALITLMAHIGSFVPADSADICITDRIFTRIGASDDLAVGQSTFMVEMVEVSNILRFATNKSLIILDEVGRGTSTHDGLSIAWSVVEYLSGHLSCKTLFATHYHELMQLEGKLPGVKNYCISIKEIAGQLVFLRKIMRGSATRSYGIEVASLAGLPKDLITRSKLILKDLEDGKIDGVYSKPTTQNLLSTKDCEVIDIIKSCDVNNISPMIAFDTLIRLIDLVKGGHNEN